MLSDLGIKFTKSIPVYEDDTSTISYLKNWDCKRLKHIDVKYNFVKDLHFKDIINVQYLPTQERKADIMTKGLSTEVFEKHRGNLGMIDC